MVINTDLECWLCHRSYRLRLELLYAGTELGTPHYWCRECCDPHRLRRLLKKIIADANKPSVHKLNDQDMVVVHRILAALDDNQTPAYSIYERRLDEEHPENEQDEDGQNEVSDEGEAREMAAD